MKTKELKKHEEIKKQLVNDINQISQNIQEKTSNQTILLQYNKYKNNIHIPIAAISFTALTFLLTRMLNIDIASSITLGIIGSSSLSLGTKIYFEKKQDDIKKSNPNIDFKNYNIDENYDLIENLFERKFELVNKLEQENKIINKIEKSEEMNTNEFEIINEKIDEKPKVKIMTLTRKK